VSGNTRYLTIAFLIGSVTILPISLRAQPQKSSSSKRSSRLTEQQLNGEGLFLRNCSLCHFPHKAESPDHIKGPNDYPKNPLPGDTLGPSLKGIFGGATPISDADARTIIQRGFPQQMPGFQYGLESKEIDDIIAFLKTL
jgi:mono/diheme cytochrome c family protein